MVLAQGETVIKEWEYGTSKKKMDVTHHSLTVTNKRIVAMSKGAHKTTREEVPVSAVKTVSLSHFVPSKVLAIVLIVLGAILAVVGLVTMFGEEGSVTGGLLLIVLGALLIVFGVSRLNQGAFTLYLTTDKAQGDLMSLGITRVLGGIFKKKDVMMKVKVKNEVIDDIMDSLGAIVVANR